MIELRAPGDINWENVVAVAYRGERLGLDPALEASIERGRALFERLIEQGVPCYGVTTGLGRLVSRELDPVAMRELPKNILRARAAGVGPPLPRPVARATMMLRLVNFVSGRDGVSSALCRFIVDRLNDGFTPWIPSLGHGMAADGVANTHCFQTLIGEGSVIADDGSRMSAAMALSEREVAPYEPGLKEGLALLNGVAGGPAIALHAHRAVRRFLDVANLSACTSFEGLAAPRDSVDPALLAIAVEPGVATVLAAAHRYHRGSGITPVKLQASASARIFPQVHGALEDALAGLRRSIESSFVTFTDNPYLTIEDDGESGRFLSNGNFHNQHLVNQIEQVALNIAHVATLAMRRLHRLLDPEQTALSPQLAPVPGLDAGLVVAHKACIDFVARLKSLAQPVSLTTDESSAGQEDYMTNLFPAALRLFEMCELGVAVLAYELLAALVALDARGQRAGEGVEAVREIVRRQVPRLERDRSPGPDVETIIGLIDEGALDGVIARYGA